MSSPTRTQDATPPTDTDTWRVRGARAHDVGAVASAVSRLLIELGATPPPLAAMEAAAVELVEEQAAGAVLVAETDAALLIGVLVASWQTAIHLPGRYALIQDLWVDPAWRSRAVGSALVAALCRLARERGVGRIEVGLPREHFAAIVPTTAFYRREGFAPLGPRMRKVLS